MIISIYKPKYFQLFNIFIFIQIISYSTLQLNNIIYFKETHYRAGYFATNKNGDIVIEYSYSNRRLFFGFKKDGSYFFNTTDYGNIPSKIIDVDENATRYEARNLFINIDNDNKEYLFSTGGFSSTEIFDLEKNNYKIFETENIMKYVIFSRAFSLLDLSKDNKKEYICIFYTYLNYEIKLIKFSFSDFHLIL